MVSSSFVTGLKRSGFNSFISVPFNATSKYPVWILFLRETHMKAHHPTSRCFPQSESPLFMCFIMITSITQHLSFLQRSQGSLCQPMQQQNL